MSEPMYKENDMVKLSLFPEGGWNKKNAGKTGAVQVTCTKPDVLFYEPYSPVFGSSRVTEDWGDQEYLIPARSEADIYKDGKYYKLVEVQNPIMANYDIGYEDGFTSGVAAPVNSKLWGKDDYESGFTQGVLDRHKLDRKETIFEKFINFFKKK